MSFLEMLDVVNERLIERGEVPIAFDHDCREGICGSCGMMINGVAHGPSKGTATCQLHMRSFKRRRHDRHRAVAGAGVSRHQGSRRQPRRARPDHRGGRLHHGADRQRAGRERDPDPEARRRRGDGRRGVHRLRRLRRRVPERLGVAVHRREDLAPRTAAAGAARALPPRAEAWSRRWTSRASADCTLFGECQEACPKEISIDVISRMNRDFLRAALTAPRGAARRGR